MYFFSLKFLFLVFLHVLSVDQVLFNVLVGKSLSGLKARSCSNSKMKNEKLGLITNYSAQAFLVISHDNRYQIEQPSESYYLKPDGFH